MAEIIEEFKTLEIFPGETKQSIKLFYVFMNRQEIYPYDFKGLNCIYVTKEDKVFAFGENSLGCLGFEGKNQTQPKEVTDLGGKGLFKFKNGSYHMIARNRNHDIYCWGFNNLGQLGRGNHENRTFGPEKNTILSDKNVIQFCCGDNHSLALTEKGEVYAWGDNEFGQVGDGSKMECVSKPVKLDYLREKIVSIRCGSMHSMALTDNGVVYSWGFNKYGQLGTGNWENSNKPTLIESISLPVKEISCSQKTSFGLTHDGDIYVFGKIYFGNRKKIEKIPYKLDCQIRFEEILSNICCSFSVGLSRDGICYLFKKGSNKNKYPEETEYKSLIEVFSKECQITNEAISVTEGLELKSPKRVTNQSSIYRKTRHSDENRDIDPGYSQGNIRIEITQEVLQEKENNSNMKSHVENLLFIDEQTSVVNEVPDQIDSNYSNTLTRDGSQEDKNQLEISNEQVSLQEKNNLEAIVSRDVQFISPVTTRVENVNKTVKIAPRDVAKSNNVEILENTYDQPGYAKENSINDIKKISTSEATSENLIENYIKGTADSGQINDPTSVRFQEKKNEVKNLEDQITSQVFDREHNSLESRTITDGRNQTIKDAKTQVEVAKQLMDIKPTVQQETSLIEIVKTNNNETKNNHEINETTLDYSKYSKENSNTSDFAIGYISKSESVSMAQVNDITKHHIDQTSSAASLVKCGELKNSLDEVNSVKKSQDEISAGEILEQKLDYINKHMESPIQVNALQADECHIYKQDCQEKKNCNKQESDSDLIPQEKRRLDKQHFNNVINELKVKINQAKIFIPKKIDHTLSDDESLNVSTKSVPEDVGENRSIDITKNSKNKQSEPVVEKKINSGEKVQKNVIIKVISKEKNKTQNNATGLVKLHLEQMNDNHKGKHPSIHVEEDFQAQAFGQPLSSNTFEDKIEESKDMDHFCSSALQLINEKVYNINRNENKIHEVESDQQNKNFSYSRENIPMESIKDKDQSKMHNYDPVFNFDYDNSTDNLGKEILKGEINELNSGRIERSTVEIIGADNINQIYEGYNTVSVKNRSSIIDNVETDAYKLKSSSSVNIQKDKNNIKNAKQEKPDEHDLQFNKLETENSAEADYQIGYVQEKNRKDSVKMKIARINSIDKHHVVQKSYSWKNQYSFSRNQNNSLKIKNKSNINSDVTFENFAPKIDFNCEKSPKASMLLNIDNNEVENELSILKGIDFFVQKLIGKGYYSSVYKVINKSEKKIYAIKKIRLKESFSESQVRSLVEELEVISKLANDYILHFEDTWIENKESLIMIMDLCYNNLKYTLDLTREELQREEYEFINYIKYFMSSELFKELLEGINYLHKLKPPLIHKNLKPTNVLITFGIDGRFVKISDFALNTNYRFGEAPQTKQSEYLAPEIQNGSVYDNKADIFSLGVITRDIFDMCSNKSENSRVTNDPILKKGYDFISRSIKYMTANRKMERPSCERLLKNLDVWALSLDVMTNKIELNELRNTFDKTNSIEDSFHKFFLKKKLNCSDN